MLVENIFQQVTSNSILSTGEKVMSTYAQELKATAAALVARGKGLLAIDESNGTCNKRFEKLLTWQ